MKQFAFLFFLSTSLFSQTITPLQVSVIDSTLLMANFATTNNTIDISNVNIMANDSTIGLFQGFTDYPVTDGLILSTGGVEWGLSTGGVSGPFGNLNSQPDPYLESLLATISPNGSSSNFHNFICIEFDFIPHFDAINFEYVFASTEYQSYTCSPYNDIFGFFLTGPGISGNYYNSSKNLAVVPGSNNTPVCINSINSGTPSFNNFISTCEYVDPDFQNYSYLFNENVQSSSNYVPFPFTGYTESLPIIDSLIPDSTYHLKMIVADVSDGALNSAVFLSANSFSSYPMDTTFWGCTDTTALNYNVNAIYDDGTCIYSNINVNDLEEAKDVLSQITNPIVDGLLQIPELQEGMEVLVYNAIGKRLLRSNETTIDVSRLNSGIYIIEITNGKVRTSGRFIKL